MNKMKKFLAGLLALVMIISLVPMSALAAETECTHDNAEYRGSYWPADKAHDRYCLDCEKAIKEPHYDDDGDCLCDFCKMAYHPNLQSVAQCEETCTTDGYKKNHWFCPDCGYRFKDSIGEYRYYNDSDIVIKADHIKAEEMSKDETHHWYECDREGCDEQLEKAEHNMEYTGQFSPADKTHQMKCSECGKFRNDPHIDEDNNCECDVCKDGYHAKLVFIEKKDATCYEDGYTEGHWYCPDCGKRYKDEATDAPINYDVVIKAGHIKAAEMSKDDTYHWYECDREGCDEQLEKAEHDMQYTGQYSPADKTHQMKCTGCGMYRNDPHVDEDENCECDVCKDGYHANFVFINKKDATCTEDGYTVDHWFCPDCGKRYKDSAADAPIYDDVVIKGGHIKAAEMSKDDTYHWYECEREGCKEQLEKAEHNMEYNNQYSPADKTHQMKCTGCGMYRNDPHIDEDKNCECDVCKDGYHANFVFIEKKDATCTEDGYTVSHWYCPDCGKRYKDEAADAPIYDDVVIKAGHIKAAEMSKNETHHWYECEREGCKEQLEKAEHEMVYNNQWSPADKTHQMKCTGCGMYRNDPHIDEDKNCECDVCKDGYHANFVFIEKKDATCEEDGYTVDHWYCPDCGKRYKDEAADAPIYDDVVIKGGHIPAEEWSTDGTHHWYECEREGCDVQLEKAEHADNDNNHSCDVCDTIVSECSDAADDGDHVCDICEAENITKCADNNNDHFCDDCKVRLTSCRDKAGDGDHACDICGKGPLKPCVDSEEHLDHFCDECGKGPLTSCRDTADDKDHACDICGHGPLNPCVEPDGDKDHECDICGASVTECVDEDKDHFCDECEVRLSYCADPAGDKDHKCDYCGHGAINPCADSEEEPDHYCDECGKRISSCRDARDDGDHKCDICGHGGLRPCEDSVNDGDHACDDCKKDGMNECFDSEDDKDHVCDECGVAMSLCADNNNDHDCDVCGEIISLCVDNTDDHKCDICDGIISLCVSEDDNHECDICGETISLCADNDNDHACDICGEVISLCADEDDHKCDICGEVISLCADEDGDHACDLCGEVISLCADEDGDHACDLCGEVISLCADEDGDHACDLCGEIISLCADNDNDHACDICGEILSECADNDNDHDCDVCGKTLSVPATPITPAKPNWFNIIRGYWNWIFR